MEVDLTNPLLAMFVLKDRHVRVEYEGLHLLCVTCGKFGYYKEGRPDKAEATKCQGVTTRGKVEERRPARMLGQRRTVPECWCKTRRPRKGVVKEV